MLPFTDTELIRRHETTVELALAPGAAPDTVRADLIERIESSVGAAIGPASINHIIVAAVDVKLAIHVGADRPLAEAIFRIAIHFDPTDDPTDDHGEGTADWAPDALLRAVVRNEVERVWRLRRMDQSLGRAIENAPMQVAA